MSEYVQVTPTLAIPESELQLRFSRSGGPGGQNVNTRDTKVEVIFDVAQSPSLGPHHRERALRNLSGRLDAEGKLHITASDERTQGQNRETAVERMRSALAEALRPDPPPRRPKRVSAAAKARRVEQKRARGQIKRLRSSVSDD